MIGAGALLVVVLGWYFLLWGPRSDALETAQGRRTAAEAQQGELQARITRLEAAQRNEPRNRARLETLRTAVPDNPNLAQFILDANDAAAAAGIEFLSIAPTPPAAPAPAAPVTTTTVAGTATTVAGTATTVATGGPAARPAEITLGLQITGGYFQVLDFMNRLDRLPRIVVTDGLTISGAGGTGTTRLTVSVQARMFTRTVPAGFGGSTTTVPGGTTTTVAGATTTTVAGATTTTVAGATTTTGVRP
jgi:Tfp pilus assembly protein PilO